MNNENICIVETNDVTDNWLLWWKKKKKTREKSLKKRRLKFKDYKDRLEDKVNITAKVQEWSTKCIYRGSQQDYIE